MLPFDHVGQQFRWLRRATFRKQVCVLMMIAQKPFGGSIRLRERQVSRKSETGFPPRRDEFVGNVPAIEADAKGIAPQDAKDLAECGF